MPNKITNEVLYNEILHIKESLLGVNNHLKTLNGSVAKIKLEVNSHEIKITQLQGYTGKTGTRSLIVGGLGGVIGVLLTVVGFLIK